MNAKTYKDKKVQQPCCYMFAKIRTWKKELNDNENIKSLNETKS